MECLARGLNADAQARLFSLPPDLCQVPLLGMCLSPPRYSLCTEEQVDTSCTTNFCTSLKRLPHPLSDFVQFVAWRQRPAAADGGGSWWLAEAAGQRRPYALCSWFGVEGGLCAVAARVKPRPLGRCYATLARAHLLYRSASKLYVKIDSKLKCFSVFFTGYC